MASETRNLKLDQIRIDGGTQPRVAIDEQVVADYAELYSSGVNLPPATVFYDGSTYWLADGFHRFLANKRIDCEFIFAEVHQGTQRDAVLFSVGANADHGLRRTNEDKKKAVLTLLNDDEWRKWSDRDIARRCGVDHTTVIKHRASLVESTSEESENSAQERTYTTKHGTTATMNTSNIGRRPAAQPSLPRRIMTREEYEADGDLDTEIANMPARSSPLNKAILKAVDAINVLKSINPSDSRRIEAMHMVRDWIVHNFG